MADPKTKNLSQEELDVLKKIVDSHEKSVEQLQEQRDLMRDISDIAKKLNVEFDATSRSFGKNIESLSIEKKLEHDIATAKFEAALHEKAAFETLLKVHQQNLSFQRDEKALADAFADSIKSVAADDYAGQEAMYKSWMDIYNDLKKEHDKIQQNLAKTAAYHTSQVNAQVGLTKNLITQQNIVNAKHALGKGLLQSANKLTGGLSANLANMVKLNPWAAIATAIIAVLESGVENFLALDKATTHVRFNLGLMRSDVTDLQDNIQSITADFMGMGVGFEDVGKSVTSLSNTFNYMVAQDRELLKTTTLFTAQLGIASDTSAKFLNVLGGISRSTTKSNIDMIGFTKQMSNAAGVPLNKIMNDVANASEDAKIYITGTAKALVTAATQARLMGTSINQMAATSKQLLDFQTSIQNELDASVLLGRNINFQYARELAYKKNIIGANAEILRIAKQLDFSSMDPFQLEAFAKAAGKTVSELQDMIVADENIQYIRQHGTAEQLKQLENFEKMKKMRDDEAKDIGKRAAKQLEQEANQERMMALQNKFNQLMLRLSEYIIPVLDMMMDIGATVLDMLDPVAKVVGNIIKLINPTYVIADSFKTIKKLIPSISTSFKDMVSPITYLDRSLAYVIEKFYGIQKTTKEVTRVISGFFDNLWSSITLRLSTLHNDIYKALTAPFDKAFNYLFGSWLANSPSEVGKAILKGITSIGGLLFDTLTMPFKSAYSFITDLFSNVKQPSEILGEYVSDTVEQPKKTTKIENRTVIDNTTNQMIVQKLDELINLMKAGAIAVNIDGNRANYLLSKNIRERGGLGATA